MSARLEPTEKREWYSPRDVEEIYGISRKTLERIRKDARERGIPLRITKLTFSNGSKTTRKRPCIRICKKSLDEYLEMHAEQGCHE